MNKKMFYEAPDAELIELKADQGIICLSGDENSIDDAEERDLGTF